MPGALEGIRVLDLAQVWAVPGAGMYLADQGAEVIKVEPPWGDDGRRVLTAAPLGEEARHFLVLNRNKRSIVVDITTPEGREIIYRLVERVDVLLQNFRPGVAERRGLDYETLRAINPRLIYVAVTPFGLKGPYANRRAYDLIVQGLAGALSARTLPDGSPAGTGVWIADCSAPMLIAYGVTLALFARERTGQGQRVDTALLAAAIAMQSVDLIQAEWEEHFPESYAAQAAYSPYRCADGSYLILVVVNEQQWQALCRVLDLASLTTDPRFATPQGRSENSDLLFPLLQERFLTRPREEWLTRLQEAEVPCAPVLTRAEVLRHPQMRENEFIVSVEHPYLGGKVDMMGIPVRLSATPGAIRSAAPQLGEHTEEVLQELGYSATEIQHLRAQKVIG
ncbi:MAG: CoA transferase [Nitrospinota bacterium]|nr:MAG: CoA transferase [Nitrospinota bacterium]